MRGPTGPALPESADELYAADPSGFVAARDALVKALRGAGDRTGADAVKALRRPSVGAWYANVAARAGLVSLREWLRLGERLRDAQASGDFSAVRAAGTERSRLEARVLRDLAAHLESMGVAATTPGLEEVRTTLRAALADEASAAALRAGRLARPLEYAGFGEVDMSAALAAMARAREEAAAGAQGRAGDPAEARPRVEPPEGEDAERRRRAEQAASERDLVATRAKLMDAQAAVRAAAARVAHARTALEAAERAAATASSNVALLAERVADLEARLDIQVTQPHE